VLPGVLHDAATWGNGTTEYALSALLAASKGQDFVCPVDPEVMLPMIHVDDLLRGLIALQDADGRRLHEPEQGYAIPGLSFTANQLFAKIHEHVPEFKVFVELDQNMSKFAKLWPDTLSTKESRADLGYEPKVGLPEIVHKLLQAHRNRGIQYST